MEEDNRGIVCFCANIQKWSQVHVIEFLGQIYFLLSQVDAYSAGIQHCSGENWVSVGVKTALFIVCCHYKRCPSYIEGTWEFDF